MIKKVFSKVRNSIKSEEKKVRIKKIQLNLKVSKKELANLYDERSKMEIDLETSSKNIKELSNLLRIAKKTLNSLNRKNRSLRNKSIRLVNSLDNNVFAIRDRKVMIEELEKKLRRVNNEK